MRTRKCKKKKIYFSVKWFCFQAAYEIRKKIWLGSPIHTEQRRSIKIFVFPMNNYLWNVQITVLFHCFCSKGGWFLRHSNSSRLTKLRNGKTFSVSKTHTHARDESGFSSWPKKKRMNVHQLCTPTKFGLQNFSQLPLVQLKLASVVFFFQFLHTSHRHSLFILFE